MLKLVFLSAYAGNARGSEFTVDSCGSVSANRTYNAREVEALVTLGVAEVVEYNDPFLPNIPSASFDKIVDAIEADFGKFEYEGEYLFYSTEEQEWKASTLLKTASHIGRVMSGFAIPADASNKKKLNRLTKLNEVYGLGLTKSEISAIASK